VLWCVPCLGVVGGLVAARALPPVPFVQAAPRRIVSLDPTMTELLFAIGAGGRLVGRSHYDLRPDSARRATDLGPGLRPNVEAIVAVHPDLVLMYDSDDNRATADKLRAFGIATLETRVDRLDEFRRATQTLGRLLHEEARAHAVVDSVDRTLARVRDATRGLPRPTVFIYTWGRPVITVGRDHFLSELVEIAGGLNAYADRPGGSATVVIEDVVKRHPDIILASPLGAADIRRDAAWRAVPAARDGRIAVYDTTIVGRPAASLGMSAVNIARLLHPDARIR
jgi:iron complex transport system substrate-binding protein